MRMYGICEFCLKATMSILGTLQYAPEYTYFQRYLMTTSGPQTPCDTTNRLAQWLCLKGGDNTTRKSCSIHTSGGTRRDLREARTFQNNYSTAFLVFNCRVSRTLPACHGIKLTIVVNLSIPRSGQVDGGSRVVLGRAILPDVPTGTVTIQKPFKELASLFIDPII